MTLVAIISRDKARELGLTRFRTGIPCSRGHDDERYTLSGSCVSCQNENWHRSMGRGKRATTERRLEPRTGTSDGFIPPIPKSRLMGARA